MQFFFANFDPWKKNQSHFIPFIKTYQHIILDFLGNSDRSSLTKFWAKIYAEIQEDRFTAKMMIANLKANLRIINAICYVLNKNSKNLEIHVYTVENIKWTFWFLKVIFFREIDLPIDKIFGYIQVILWAFSYNTCTFI